jgi:hypothetical protein
MKTTLAICLAFLCLLAVVGCDTSEETTIVQPPDPLPAPITVTAAGSCRGGANSIQCRDQSVCKQGAATVQCTGVDWNNEDENGFAAGSTTSNPGDTIQMTGLAPGDYTVTQTTRASDGRTAKVVHNVTVGGP